MKMIIKIIDTGAKLIATKTNNFVELKSYHIKYMGFPSLLKMDADYFNSLENKEFEIIKYLVWQLQ